MSNQNADPQKTHVRLTLPDDSTVELTADQIQQVSQDMGDIRQINDICGIHPLFGPSYCPECKTSGNLDGCGRWFVAATERGEPELIEVQLKDGKTLYVKDLQISTPPKLSDASPLQKVATALSGLSVGFIGNSFSSFTSNIIERQRLLATIAGILNCPEDEVKYFYQAHSYSLEFIEQAVRAGAKLDEEDIKRTMEKRTGYITDGWPALNELETFSAATVGQAGLATEQYTFIVTTPDGDRTSPIKAADCYTDQGALCFDDENDVTIMIFAAGHWVKVERVEEEQSQNPT